MIVKRQFHKKIVCGISILALLAVQIQGVDSFAALTNNTAKIDTGWTDTGKVNITINTSKEHTSISPYIYGVCADGSLSNVTVNAVKQSGMALSAYNWETNYANLGISGNNQNDITLIKGYAEDKRSTPALFTENLITKAKRYNIPNKYVTLQMMGYAANDLNGVVAVEDAYLRFAEVIFNKNDSYLSEPDTSDNIVYMDEYVSYLTNLYGYAREGGINGYFLDYEPENWKENFPVLQLEKLTASALVEKSAALSAAVKKVDRSALIFGPSVKGLESFVNLHNTSDWETYSNNYSWFIDYYLDKMSAASDKVGTRLLDVLDVHFITEAYDSLRELVVDNNTVFSNAERMQAVRILWDSSYTENSSSAINFKQHTPIIPILQASIRMYYPGTKLSFSEYNFGGGSHISGAIAQADVLGIFAKENVYMASLLPNTTEYPYQKSAINIYTNYDGNGSSFGNTLVAADNNSDNMSSVYAAINQDDDTTLKAVLINKNQSIEKTAEIKIESSEFFDYADIYCISKDTVDIIKLPSVSNIQNNSFSYDMDPLSIYLFEFGKDTNVIDDESIESDSENANTEKMTTISKTVTTAKTTSKTGSKTSVASASGDKTVVNTEVPISASESTSDSKDISQGLVEKSSSSGTTISNSGSDNLSSNSATSVYITENLEGTSSIISDVSEPSNGVPSTVKAIILVLVGAVFVGITYIMVIDSIKTKK